ncbi:MAG TPA: phosphopantetheine-binding protein [Herpetosiphonaceae bacterium]
MAVDVFSEKLEAVLRRHLKFLDQQQELPLDTELSLLGLDSLSAINMLLDLEETFEIMIPDELLSTETFRSASTLEAALRTLV